MLHNLRAHADKQINQAGSHATPGTPDEADSPAQDP